MGPLRGPGAEDSARRWRAGSRVQRGRRRPSCAEYKGERGKGRGLAAGCGLLAQAGCVEGLWKSSQVVHAFGVRVEAAPFGRGI